MNGGAAVAEKDAPIHDKNSKGYVEYCILFIAVIAHHITSQYCNNNNKSLENR